jgi:hypothetical protein
MKHATSESLDRINTLLDEIRSFDGLREKTRGVFYLKSQAFLHFHEDDGTMFADVRQRPRLRPVLSQNFDRPASPRFRNSPPNYNSGQRASKPFKPIAREDARSDLTAPLGFKIGQERR